MIKNISLLQTQKIHGDWSTLSKITYEYETPSGEKAVNTREAYDRGNGAVILLYHPVRKTVILTKQFRLPTLLNGNDDGMMIEACAGRLDTENPEACIIRETREETGFAIQDVQKVLEAYMSPGSVTEILHFYIAKYSPEMKVNEGGGLDEEHEYIEVLEISFHAAMQMIQTGEIKDAKTIILLQHLHISQLI